MDQNSNQMALVLVEIPGCSLYRLINNNRSKLTSGVLKLAQLQETKSYFISIEKFCQNIVEGTPFVRVDSDKGTSLLFPHIDQGLNGIFLPKVEEHDYFLTQLQTVVQIIGYEQALGIPLFKDTIQTHCYSIQQFPLEQGNNTAAIIQKSGENLKSGLMWFGGFLANSINSGGQYLNSKVDQGQAVEVSDATKSKVSNFREKASQAFEVTGSALKYIYEPVAEKTKELTNNIAQKIDQSDSKFLKEGKSLTSATWDAAGQTLSGVGAALSVVGESIGSNTKLIVEKKYGPQVTSTITGQEQAVAEQELVQPLLVESDQQVQKNDTTYQNYDLN